MRPGRRVLILGGGPVGIEAALSAAHLGHDVRVLEAGRVGESLRSWGHVRMFSPWEMNCSSLGLRCLAEESRVPFGDPHDAPTGSEFLERYLRPVASSRLLRGAVLERTRVVAIGRQRTLKEDLPGGDLRSRRPFRVLAETGGRRGIHAADVVIDATGTWSQPRALGDGGIPAPGEREAESFIERGLPDLDRRDVAARFASRTILLVGAGHTAATSAVALARLATRHPDTRIVWAFRRDRRPLYARVPGDPLAARDALCAEANGLASGSLKQLEARPGRVIESMRVVRRHGEGRVEVTLAGGRDGGVERLAVDRIVANVGSVPDSSIHSELQAHLCYATSGPMKLAAALLGKGGDCLDRVAASTDMLGHPEPDFFILGSKSYGRNPTFLLRAGLEQIEAVFGRSGERAPRARPPRSLPRRADRGRAQARSG